MSATAGLPEAGAGLPAVPSPNVLKPRGYASCWVGAHGTRLADHPPRLARRLAHRLHRALQPGVPWEPARLRPIADQQHLQNTFFYVLGQQEHHGLDLDPWQEGSALPDLLGLRPAGVWMAANVRAHLPRIRRDERLARLAAVYLARGVPPPLLAPVLGLGARQLRRLADEVPPPAMIRAVEGWWNLFSNPPQPDHSRSYKISACG